MIALRCRWSRHEWELVLWAVPHRMFSWRCRRCSKVVRRTDEALS